MQKIVPESSKKSGAVMGGWICLILGLLILGKSVWLVIFYGPLFAISLILGIVALSQGRKGHGLGIILTAVIAVPVIWGLTGLVRSAQAIENTAAWMDAHPPPNWQAPVLPVDVEAPAPVKVTEREPGPTKQSTQPLPPSSNVNTTITVAASQPDEPRQPEIQQSKFADLLKQDFTQADARSIQLAHIERIPANVNIEVTPSFSNDGQKVAFVNEAPSGRLAEVSIFDLATFTVTKTLNPSELVYKLCWSPDDNKLFYVSNQGANHVLDISTGKDLLLPIQDGALNHTVTNLRWPTSDKVIARYSEPYLITLSLDSLTTTKVHYSDRDKIDSLFRSSRSHSKAFITSQDLNRLGGEGSYLVVKNQDDSAITPLVANVREDAWYVVEPSLHTVLLLSRDEVRVVFMKSKEPGQYRWGFSLPEKVQQQRGELVDYVKKGVPFHAKVYAPAVNPLNGKIVGIDRQRFKGWVTIKEWRKMTDVTAVTVIEFNPIAEGDIVTEIKSDQWGDFGNHPFDFGDYWTAIALSKTNGTSSNLIPANDQKNQQVSHNQPASAGSSGGETEEERLRRLIVGGWNNHRRFSEYFTDGRYVHHPRRSEVDEEGKWQINGSLLVHTPAKGPPESNKIVSLDAKELALDFGTGSPTLYFERVGNAEADKTMTPASGQTRDGSATSIPFLGCTLTYNSHSADWSVYFGGEAKGEGAYWSKAFEGRGGRTYTGEVDYEVVSLAEEKWKITTLWGQDKDSRQEIIFWITEGDARSGTLKAVGNIYDLRDQPMWPGGERAMEMIFTRGKHLSGGNDASERQMTNSEPKFTEANIQTFIASHHLKASRGDIANMVSDYDQTVTFLDKGQVSPALIQEEETKDRAKWPKGGERIIGQPTVVETTTQWLASYTIEFYRENVSGGWMSGKIDLNLAIRSEGSRLLISSQKAKVYDLKKSKGR